MRVRWVLTGFVIVAAALAASAPAVAQVQVSTADGTTSMKFGFLLQPQAEFLETTDGEHTTQNLYIRRARLLFGGNILGDKLTYFIETDSPNLGKVDPASSVGDQKKANMYVQDAFITWSSGDAFKVDMGMLLPAVFHNHGQGAGSLLAVDYGAYTFASGDHEMARVGRDYGFEVRGYPFQKHLEYRAGLLQGNRTTTTSNNPFRYFGRLVWYPFEADSGFFYTGTNLGKKKILGVGVGYDAQREYSTLAADVYWDWPVFGGDAVTIQADYSDLQGDPNFSPSLADQKNMLFEAGYYFGDFKLEPFVQLASQNYDAAASSDNAKYLIGLAYWASGHKWNVKLAGGRVHTDTPAEDGYPENRNYLVLQAQAFFY